MIVEITVRDGPDEITSRLRATEVVGYEECHDAIDAPVAVRVLMRGGIIRTALYDTLTTFTERLQAALGGSFLQIHALPLTSRPVRAVAIAQLTPDSAATEQRLHVPNGQIIVEGVNAPPGEFLGGSAGSPPLATTQSTDASGHLPKPTATSETKLAPKPKK